MSWKDDARRLIIGEKKDLESFEGYWIKPRKFSIKAKDEIAAVQRKIQKGIDKKSLASMMEKAKDVDGDDQRKVFEVLTSDELEAMVDMQNIESKDLVKIKLMHGIAEHNFGNETVEKLSEDILDFESVAIEMLNIVEDFNRPLVEETPKTSKT